MKTILSDVLIYLVSLIICVGCSVKERRELCPCRLELDFSEVDTAVICSADLDVSTSDSFVLYDHIDEPGSVSGYVVDVPRELIRVNVWYGGDGHEAGKGLRIPYGEQAPRVYFHSSEVDARCESCRELVLMRKNHCNVTIRITGDGSGPINIALLGNVDGYMNDGRPSQGPFRAEERMNGDGICSIVLPRQLDDSLVMELDNDTGILTRFALGEYIAESGYDWNAPDLEDIVIDLDFAVTHLTLVIQGWEKEYKYDVVI